ncbi:MAG: extracellular solute-binding protein [bacterium]|nr:extracellular solute-binding protein [bacterium]MDZ4285991.1 extracellular solute-binding protein [Candidatus Sungbacteria bacterium]
MNPKKIIIIIVAAIILIQALVFFRILPGRNAPAPGKLELSFWGFDDELILRDIIQNFQKQFPYITVNYTQLDAQNYEETVVNKIAEGAGPDVFMLANTAFLKNRDKIYPLPEKFFSYSARDFAANFVDATYLDLVGADGAIYGLPLFIDTPVLFYNKDILNAAGIAQVPSNWEDLAALSRQLTQKNAVGQITKSGLPLGTSRSVDNSFEILSSLMLQEGDSIIQRTPLTVTLGDGGFRALTFYASFASPASPNYSWSDRMPPSLIAFTQNTSAFVIGFQSDIKRIRAGNPHLNFGISPFPQKKQTTFPVVGGKYFFPTVLKFSKNPVEAWRLVTYMTSQEGAKIYFEKTGRPPVRRDILSSKSPTPELDAFYRQALIAKTWPIPNEKATRSLFQEAVDAVVSGTAQADQAINNLHQRLDLLLPK